MATSDERLPIGITPNREYTATWLDLVHFCLEHEFVGVEFKYEPPFTIPQMFNEEMVDEVGKLGQENDLIYSIHLPYSNLGELKPSRWNCVLEEYLEAIEVAKRIGASTVTSHSGHLLSAYYPEDFLPQCRENTVKALNRILQESGDIDYCIENRNKLESAKMKVALSPEDLKELAVDVNREVSFTIDLGHVNTFGLKPTEFAQQLGPGRIGVAHLHDNDGTEDSHQAVGEGNIDYHDFLSFYKKGGYEFPLFLEVRSEEAMLKSKERLEEIWSEL